MALNFNIPLPGSFGEAFNQGSDVQSSILSRMIQGKAAQQTANTAAQLAPSQIELAKAQALQARITAQQTEQDTNFANKLLNGGDIFNSNGSNTAPGQNGQPGQPGKPNQPGQQQKGIFGPTHNMEPQERYKRAKFIEGATRGKYGKVDIQEVNGTKYAVSPYDAPIPILKGPTQLQKDISAQDAKTVGAWNESLDNIHNNVNPIMDNVKDILSNPEFPKMKQNPEFFGHDMKWYKRFGSPEEQKIASGVASNLANLRQQMLQGFKGSAREWENKIIDDAKIDEKDTMPSMMAKFEELTKIKKAMSERMQLANDLVRSEKALSPSQAMQEAEKVIGYDKIKKEVQSTMYNIRKSQLSPYIAEAKQAGYSEEQINAAVDKMLGAAS